MMFEWLRKKPIAPADIKPKGEPDAFTRGLLSLMKDVESGEQKTKLFELLRKHYRQKTDFYAKAMQIEQAICGENISFTHEGFQQLETSRKHLEKEDSHVRFAMTNGTATALQEEIGGALDGLERRAGRSDAIDALRKRLEDTLIPSAIEAATCKAAIDAHAMLGAKGRTGI